MTISMVLLALTGLLISVLMKLARMRKRFRKEFSFRVWLQENSYQSIATVLSVAVMLHFTPLMAPVVIGADIPPDTLFYDLFALCAGYSNYQLFHDMMKMYKPGKGDPKS